MGYWDKKAKNDSAVVNRINGIDNVDDDDDAPDMTLEEFEQMAQEKLEDDGKYLSKKIKSTQKRLQTVTSDGFWFAVYFNNDLQKEEFLKKMGFDKDLKFIEGKEFVKRYHKSISEPDFDFGQEKRPVAAYAMRARKVTDQVK